MSSAKTVLKNDSPRAHANVPIAINRLEAMTICTLPCDPDPALTHLPPTPSLSCIISNLSDLFSSPPNFFFAHFPLNHLLYFFLVVTFGQVHGAVLAGSFFPLPRDGLDRRLTRYVCSVLFCLALLYGTQPCLFFSLFSLFYMRSHAGRRIGGSARFSFLVEGCCARDTVAYLWLRKAVLDLLVM